MTPLQMSYRIWPVVLLESLLLLLTGFVLLVLSGDKLVDTSVAIARRWKVPASVIAATIIAAGTSAPEIFTSFIAGYQGNSDISVGNVIGSNIFNILAVGGISLALQPYGKVSNTRNSWIILIVATLLFFFALSDFQLTSHEAMIFIGALSLYVVLSFFQERDNGDSFENLDNRSTLRLLFFFTLSFIGLISGAELALTGGVDLGKMAGLSERVIAITIISVGTGLPELATSVAAAFRGHSDIAIANIIGSNIFNTLIIPGATAFFFPLTVHEQMVDFDFYIMATASISLGLLYFIKDHKARRIIGFMMFIAYSAYATNLILTA